MNRRQFLQSTGLGATGLVATLLGGCCPDFTIFGEKTQKQILTLDQLYSNLNQPRQGEIKTLHLYRVSGQNIVTSTSMRQSQVDSFKPGEFWQTTESDESHTPSGVIYYRNDGFFVPTALLPGESIKDSGNYLIGRISAGYGSQELVLVAETKPSK